MRRTARYIILAGMAALFVTYFFSGCSPLYVMRAAYEESKILLNREPIIEKIEDETLDPVVRQKLVRVLEAREYSRSMCLDPEESFTLYSKLDRDVLAWVLLASKKDSFTLHSWWFPFVGVVPYKGFFEKEDAVDYAKSLTDDGYEIFIRPTDAFSTLGWFNDPILSTTLKHEEHVVVNTVLHETVHTTIWIPDHVAFNESLANFVGTIGAYRFYSDHLAGCESCSEEVRSDLERQIKVTEANISYYLELSRIIEKLYGALKELYDSEVSEEEKLSRRDEIFHQYIAPLKAAYPGMKAFKKLNNAEIMQLKLYVTGFECFYNMFVEGGRDWQTFFDGITKIKERVESDKANPYRELMAHAPNCIVDLPEDEKK